MPHLDKFPKLGYQEQVIYSHLSDGSEPSWLEPALELKDFQLGSDLIVTFFPSAQNRKSAENEPIFFSSFCFAIATTSYFHSEIS